MTLSATEKAGVDPTFLGSMLFTRLVSGARVVPRCNPKVKVCGKTFKGGFGAHADNYHCSYMTMVSYDNPLTSRTPQNDHPASHTPPCDGLRPAPSACRAQRSTQHACGWKRAFMKSCAEQAAKLHSDRPGTEVCTFACTRKLSRPAVGKIPADVAQVRPHTLGTHCEYLCVHLQPAFVVHHLPHFLAEQPLLAVFVLHKDDDPACRLPQPNSPK
mmetsp:Transcript_9972/g.30419  ORF Transcript_9972/g.30419 Transcript_9972/m.30419 type:complete len:215 (+) Transcript_9972:1355-1999(+)